MITARERVFVLLAIGFAAAAVFHAVAMVSSIDPTSPRWRHGLFVAIDLALAVLMLRRPRWFVWVFALLLVQQAWSHGSSLIAHAKAGKIDLPSIVTLLVLPVVLLLLIRDARK